MENCVGKIEPVLFERETEKGVYEGYMTNYVKVRVKSEKDVSGQILNVKTTDSDDNTLIGEIIQ